jgi:Flp pilus assembly protein TadG
MLMTRRVWRRFAKDDGANLVEAALGLPLVLWVLCAGVEFAGILYAQMTLQNGVTLATRYAITQNVLPGQTRQASIITTLNADTPSLTIDPSTITFSHLAPGSTTWAAGDGSPGSVEKIAVDYTWHLLTPFMPSIFGATSITLHAEASMKNESAPGT